MGLNRCKLSTKVQSRLVEFFVLEVTARSAASVLGLQPNTTALYYRKLRQLIADQLALAEHEVFDGAVELDESYFGGVRKGKRGRGAAGKVVVFGLLKRGGKVWINVYPDRPMTKHPAESRMGSGKGSPEWWIANIKPGRVLFELSGVPEEVAREAMRLAIHKLPFKARFIKREAGEI